MRGPKIYIFLFFIFFLLRFWGIHFGLPFDGIHPTEHFSITHALQYLTTADFKPYNFQHPTLFQYLIALFAYVFGLPPQSPVYFYLLGRMISCLASFVSLCLLYSLSRRLFKSEVIGLLSASFLGLNLLSIQYAHYAVPDSLSLVFLAAAMLFAYKIFEKPALKNYLFCGLFCGLTIGAKFSGLISLGFLFCAHFFIKDRKTVLWRNLVLGLLAAFISFFLASPYHILCFKEAIQDARIYLGEKGYLGPAGFRSSGFFVYPFVLLPGVLGMLGSLSALLGMAAMLFKETRKALFLFIPLALYILFIAREHGATLQNLLVLLPVLSIFAAYTVYCLKEKKMSRPFVILLAVLILLPGLAKAIIFDFFLLKPDPRVLAQEWLLKNVDNKSRIAFERYGPFDLNYLSGSQACRQFNSVYLAPTVSIYPASFYRQQGYGYIVTSGFREDSYKFFCRTEKKCREADNYQTYEKQLKLVASFEPPYIFKLIGGPFPWGTWPHQPTVKIYRLKKS